MLIMKEIRPYDPPFPSESQVVLSWRAAPNWRNAGPRRLPVKFVRFAVPKKPWNLQVSVFVTHGVFPQGWREPKNQTQEDFAIFCPLGFFKKLKLKMARSWQKFEGAGFDKIFITDHRRESFCSFKQHIPICSMIFHAFIFHPFQNWQEGTSRWGLFWWLGILLPCHNYFQSRNETSIFFNPKEWTNWRCRCLKIRNYQFARYNVQLILVWNQVSRRCFGTFRGTSMWIWRWFFHFHSPFWREG